MKAIGQRILDHYRKLRECAERQLMLVRNAVGSAWVEGIYPDEARLWALVGASAAEPAKRS